MNKKIIVIFLGLLFIFSMLPTVQSSIIYNKDKVTEQELISIDGIWVEIYYGTIVYNSEELREEPWGMCYNVTPKNLKGVSITIIFGQGVEYNDIPFYGEYLYFSQNKSRGVVTNNFLFLWGISTFPS